MVARLAQGVIPAPEAQILYQQGMVEFAIPDQTYFYPDWQQTVHIRQQLDLLGCAAVPTTGAYPGPSYRQGSPPIRQTDHQQAMSSTDLTRINYQADLPTHCGHTQHPAGKRIIPFSNVHFPVVQKASKAFDDAQLLGSNWHFTRCQLHLHAARLENPHHQPDHICQTTVTVIRNALQQILMQATIQGGNGDCWHPVRSKWFCLSNSTLLGLQPVFNPIPLAHLFSVR